MRAYLVLLCLAAAPAWAREKPACDLKQAGFHNPVGFNKFFVNLQQAAADKNVGAISRMVNYPLRIGNNQRIANESELKKKFDSVFTPAVLRAITGQKRSELLCDHRGATIGDGTVWIQEVEGVVVISTLHEKP